MRKQIFRFLNYLNIFYKLRSPKGLRVLAYHTVPDAGKFEKQLEYLRKNFSIIDIHQLRAHLFNGVSLPNDAVLITFDDGDISVLENGLPVMKKRSIPAVLFVISGLIDTNETFWCRWIEIDHQKKGMSYSEARAIVNRLKEVPEAERKAYLDDLTPVFSRQLSRQDLKELSQNNIYIANHTHTHPMINNCSEEEIRQELFRSCRKFRQWGIEGYSVFAYPNGNWDPGSENILRDEGIEMAFLFDHKINSIDLDPLRISRIRVDSDQDLQEFKVKVSGLHSRVMNIKNKFRRLSS